MIDEINVEIEELMRVLERKKKEKEMLNLEKQVHERKIEQVRQKYRDELSGIDESLQKAVNSLSQNEKELKEFELDQQSLNEYEQHYQDQMSKFKDEFRDLDDMEKYLEFNSVAIDQTNKERKDIRLKHNDIFQQ